MNKLNYELEKLKIYDYDDLEDFISSEHIIIESFDGKIIDKKCRFIGKEKNRYWLVFNIQSSEQYYLIECCGNRLTKVDEESMEKILELNKTLTICNNYVVIEMEKNKKIALHAFLMNHSGNGKGQDSVDHINQDKLDNRLCNLRITTQSIQNSNRPYEKQEDSKYNLYKPESMKHIERLPRHVTYYTENRKTNDKITVRDYFVLEHPSCPEYGKKNRIISSKSMSISAIDKYNFILEKMKELKIDIKFS